MNGVDPHLVDFALAAIALEALALLGWRAVTGGGPARLPLLSWSAALSNAAEIASTAPLSEKRRLG